MEDEFAEFGYVDSTRTKLAQIIPTNATPSAFEYEYDFGDSWYHEILFEDLVPAETGKNYPRCTEGERACPPEDVGGIRGYREFLEAMTDHQHKRHKELREWIGGDFDPVNFDPAAATKEMKKGLPEWRNEEWV
jgi:hypothetical protein